MRITLFDYGAGNLHSLAKAPHGSRPPISRTGSSAVREHLNLVSNP
jgi:hypothetical protein